MRTIKVEMHTKIDATSDVCISTEAIVDDDANAQDAGEEARVAMDAFIDGYIGDNP